MRWLVAVTFVWLATFACAGETLVWNDLAPLPDEFGFGGPIVGVHRDALIVAGGANFPNGPPWQVGDTPPGNKVWHDRIWVLVPGADAWIDAGRLPYPLAYAATVSTSDGVYVFGGETFDETNHPTAATLRLSWDADARQVRVRDDVVPPLPRPSQYHQAALIGDTVFVAASSASRADSERLDVKSFWSFDLKATGATRGWNELEPWPGAPREKMSLVVQASGADANQANPMCVYLFSGENWFKDRDRVADLSRYENFTDAYRYHPGRNEWTRIADLPAVDSGADESAADASVSGVGKPRPAVAATAIAVGPSHVLLFSGANDRSFHLPLEQRPAFPREVLAYHTITDTWTVVGEMPEGVVTTTCVRWQDQIVIPSGEIRPGVRTNRVQALSLEVGKSKFGPLNLVVLGLYLLVLVATGVYFSRGERGTDDFFLAGKRIPWWAAGISIYATQLSAITFVSLPAVPYSSNWLVYPGQLATFLFVPIVVIFYLPFFRKLNITTAYEYLEVRFNLAVRLFGSLSFIVFQLGRMAVVVYLPALALAAVTGIDVYACILVMGVLATLYTTLGGMEAVIWTDVIQTFVLWGGIFVSILIMLNDLGGPSSVFETAMADHKLTLLNPSWDTGEMATWLIVLGSLSLQFAPYTTDQAVVQRYMTTKDEAAAARSLWLNGILTVPFSFLFFVLGTCLYVFFKSHPELLVVGMENDKVFPLFMAEQLPAGVSGLVIAGVFAASMSSLDSSIHSVATSITTDFYGRLLPQKSDQDRLRLARILTVVIGSIGTGTAILLASAEVGSLFFFFQKLLGLLSSGLAGVFILGIFTKRANANGVLCGAAASFVCLCYVVFWTDINFYLYAVIGISVAVIVGYVASWLLKPSH